MKVFLLKDVEKVGMAGEIINIADGFAYNFLFPRKLALEVTLQNEAGFEKRKKSVEKREAVIESKSSMLAERIKSMSFVLKTKVHDDDKLYGSIGAAEIVDVLAEKGIVVAKNQVLLDKAIKKAGSHQVTLKLSSRLQPTFTLKIVPEAE